MAALTKRRTKMSFKDALEKRRTDLEELMIKTTMVGTLSDILGQSIEEESSPFSSDQKLIPILNDAERELLKSRMISLIEKYFK